MTVKITILYDNRCDNSHLQEGWGFSALVEYDGSKILFDTGGDESAFSSNIEKMQLSYKEVTHLLFSHRHWDHIAGFKEIEKKKKEKKSVSSAEKQARKDEQFFLKQEKKKEKHRGH